VADSYLSVTLIPPRAADKEFHRAEKHAVEQELR
jgi:hypothetical protein